MDDVDYCRWVEYYITAFYKMEMQPKTILDLACGTGNLSIPLAMKGYQVIGVDLSEDMLFVAAEKARKAGIRIPFVYQNICSLELHRKVDAMICGCDGINYLDSLEKVQACFESASRYLKENGLFIFDISSKYKFETVLCNNFYGEDREEVTYLWQNEFSGSICKMDLTFFVKNGDYYEKFREVHYQRAHEIEEITELLKLSGFTITGIYHEFTFQPVRADSERIHFLAKK